MDLQEFDKMYAIEESNWWYRGRRKLVEGWVKKLYAERGPLKILDIACATGMSFRYLAKYGEIWGIDISDETIRLCGQRGIDRIIQCDAMELPFGEGSFDLILALDSLEHFEDDRQAIAEMSRVTKKGGMAVITVPAFMFLWSDHDVAYHHFRRYTAKELRLKLSEGYQVDKLSYYSMTVLPPVWAMRKLRSKPKDQNGEAHSDFFIKLPDPIEWTLGAIMNSEIALMKGINLPFGVSLFSATRKV